MSIKKVSIKATGVTGKIGIVAALLAFSTANSCGKSDSDHPSVSLEDTFSEESPYREPDQSYNPDLIEKSDGEEGFVYPCGSQAVFNSFAQDLGEKDLEWVITTYFDPATQNKYRKILSQQDLNTLSQQYQNRTLIPEEEGDVFQEYNFLGDDGTAYCVQFMEIHTLEGKCVWKIRNLN